METSSQLIGPAGEIAAVMLAKAARLKKKPDAPLKALFYGPPGVGKSHLVAQVSSFLTSGPFDVDHRNGREVTIEVVRGWLADLPQRSAFGDWQIKIVDELDCCTRDAQDLMLTFLDRMPAGHAFLGTSNLQLDLLAERFQTRLQQFKIEPPTAKQIASHLTARKIPRDMAEQIASGSGGNVRAALLDAETFLDMRSAKAGGR